LISIYAKAPNLELNSPFYGSFSSFFTLLIGEASLDVFFNIDYFPIKLIRSISISGVARYMVESVVDPTND